MDEVVMLLGEKPRELLDYALDSGTSLNLSWTELGRWRTAPAEILEVCADSFVVQIASSNKAQPLILALDQLVGVSFRDKALENQDRFIFGTNVLNIDFGNDAASGPEIALAMPEEIEVVRGKNYLRTTVPSSVAVDVELWHRTTATGLAAQVCHGYTARLVELGADGMQLLVTAEQGPDFADGQYVGLKFTPLPNETPLSFSACVRHVLAAWDGTDLALELEMVGLEAAPEGRMVLRRLCSVVGMYRQMLQTQPAQQPHAARHVTAG
jgi:hypothetical protein